MFKISTPELQDLLNNLQKKPYVETVALIAMIQKLQPLEEKKKNEK